MFRGAAVPLAMILVVVGVGPSLAAPHSPYSLTDEDLISYIIMNQVKTINGLNESISSIASHDDELNQLREEVENGFQVLIEAMVNDRTEMNDRMEGMNTTQQTGITAVNERMNNEIQRVNEAVEEGKNERHEINGKIDGMNATLLTEVKALSEKLEDETNVANGRIVTATKQMNDRIEGMNATLQRGITTLTETMSTEIQRVNEAVEEGKNERNEIADKIEGVKSTLQTGITALSETINNEIQRVNEIEESVMEKLEVVQNAIPAHHQRPDPADLHVMHNDTAASLCEGHKVLYGSYGGLHTSSSNYNNNMQCSWTVTLPEGSRPVFDWHYMNIEECSPCSSCDYMFVRDIDHMINVNFCGDNPPDGSYLTIMNNKFKVYFQSDGSVTGRGFNLAYRAVEMN